MFLRRITAAPNGWYFTPRNASGISATMISALKITALRIALCGECRYMMFSLSSGPCPPAVGIEQPKHRRQDREIFRYVIGDAESRQRAARHQQLLANLDDFNELRRVAVEVHHVTGFARGL